MWFIEKILRKNYIIYYISRAIYELFFSNFFFEPECELFSKLKKKNKINIIDVGSSNQVFSRYISNFLYNSKFYCFEPLYFLHKQIRISKNKNIFKLFKYGCGNKSEKVLIYIPYKKFFNFKIYFKFFASINLDFLKKCLKHYFNKQKFFFQKKIVKLKKIDDHKFKPHIIKIDTENYEFKVLLGAVKTIKLTKPLLIVEHPTNKVDNLLKKMNYDKYQYLKKTKKLKKLKANNKFSRNYIYIHKQKKIENIFYN